MRTVLLLSGGLDSYTAGAIAKAEGAELYALTIRYGQVHAREVDAARDVAKALGVVRHLELDVPLSKIGGSSLVGDGAIPKDRRVDANDIPSTYVPARNTVFLSLAMAYAEVVLAEAIVIGVNALDYSGYPDCRPEFLRAFERVAALATKAGVEGRRLRILAPLVEMSKRDIIRRGTALGVDYGLTLSCYDPSPEGTPCGRCDSCILRARGFAEAGLEDPALLLRRADGGGTKITKMLVSARLHPESTMTERLYYTDPYLREFDATLLDTTSHEGQTALVLDCTAFYPTSGGQPADRGAFGDVRVLDVVDTDEGRILHVVDRAPSTTTLHGTIDWTRRFDHMQQHTGQHVLSAAFDRLFGVRTESFHLGVDYSTIDLAREVSGKEIAGAESEANRIVWEDRPVGIRFASSDEAAAMGLRKASRREGTLRLIDVEGFDLSACGGTHVARTGAIGIIAVGAAERLRGGSRITFLCGGRALGGYHALLDAVNGSVRALSVLPAELPAAVERLQAEGKELRKQIKDFQLKLAAQEADALADAAAGKDASGRRVVLSALPGWDAVGLKTIASRVIERPGYAAVLISEPPPAAIVVARSADVSLDSGAILRRLVELHGGKGGGRPELAQGGGLTSSSEVVLQSARELLGL